MGKHMGVNLAENICYQRFCGIDTPLQGKMRVGKAATESRDFSVGHIVQTKTPLILLFERPAVGSCSVRSAEARIVGNNKLVISGNKKIEFDNPHTQIRSLAEGLNGILGKERPRSPVCLYFKMHTIKKACSPSAEHPLQKLLCFHQLLTVRGGLPL